jgi:hypothetical protein
MIPSRGYYQSVLRASLCGNLTPHSQPPGGLRAQPGLAGGEANGRDREREATSWGGGVTSTPPRGIPSNERKCR